MTKDEIIKIAKQAGWEMDDSLVLEPELVWYLCQGQLETFAKLVAQHEREACAKICELKAETMAITGKSCDPDDLAKAIRARNQ